MDAITENTEKTIENKQENQNEKTDETPAAKETGAVIYVGPPIPGTILSNTFIIFADGVPKEYKEHKTLKHLFIPPARLEQARREIGKKGSLRNVYYTRAVKESNKKGGK